ncbi:patatin [Lampropedia cohaerens]|uniref:Patatin n=1 Tax=Lampropedia cohaerens TaxID=1610491 RepID=A0A0U1Q2J6_9BURK|nr:patatin-like phospholipase family protein [Lampropedia cohaerens]KKW68972.1 patatin [Lampropedia cohaerens]
MHARKPRLGLALGSGSARGWSHIGVVRTLQQAGFTPDIVCGTSIGALVGAIHAAGQLDWLEKWVRKLDWQGILALMDFGVSGGLLHGRKLMRFFEQHMHNHAMEQLPLPFACVATELDSGREVWLQQGSVIEAVRASIALPGLFTPARIGHQVLVDGGLVNPVPVSLCRAMGAEVVVAVDLNWDLIGRRARAESPVHAKASAQASGWLGHFFSAKDAETAAANARSQRSMLGVLVTSLNIMQVRITQSRLAGEPADVLIRPRLSDIGAMDFDKAALAIRQGEAAARLMLPQLADAMAA